MPRNTRQKRSPVNLESEASSMPQSQYFYSLAHPNAASGVSGANNHQVYSPVRQRSNPAMNVQQRNVSSGPLRSPGLASATSSGTESSASLVSSSSQPPMDRGSKLKRAFGALRKASDPAPSSSSPTSGFAKLFSASTTSLSLPASENPTPRNAKHLKIQMGSVFGSKTAKNETVSTPTSPLPPSPPPKSPPLQQPPANSLLFKSPANSPTLQPPVKPRIDPRGSIMPATAGIAAALQFMRENDDSGPTTQSQLVLDRPPPNKSPYEARTFSSRQPESRTVEKENVSEDGKRNSDSNMSFNTIRGERPVSMADSLLSTHTIVPANKRYSGILKDADTSMPEEEESNEDSNAAATSSRPRKTSIFRTAKALRRQRSTSLPRSRHQSQASSPTTSSPSTSEPPTSPRSPGIRNNRATDAVASPETRTAERSVRSGRRDRAVDMSIHTTSTSLVSERTLPDLPPPTPRLPPETHAWPQSPRPASNWTPEVQRRVPIARPPAISATGGFGSKFAKRAVERMGRAWGGMGGGGGNANASSTDDDNNGGPSKGQAVKRRTPNAPSNSWSIGSGRTSTSNPDSGQPKSILGKQIRKPIQPAGGLVFGQDLRTCVENTAVTVGADPEAAKRAHIRDGSESAEQDIIDDNALQARRLPALVVRCTQHLMAWGVQEEGLFRVSGRASHIATLRAEFDTGADFDIYQCSLGDLDPHAVSSIFKAYLRELPEPILTNAMMPYFEAVMNSEAHTTKLRQAASPPNNRGLGLPTGPTGGNSLPAIRKAPSLTTLGLPNTADLHAPSEELTQAFRSLVQALPVENRHLMQTVTELICATAKRSKQTKMPMSNLLLVFCPSLHMNPPLLRALCEAKGIWDEYDEEGVLDIIAPSDESGITINIDASDDLSDENGETEGPQDDTEETYHTPSPDSSEHNSFTSTEESNFFPSHSDEGQEEIATSSINQSISGHSDTSSYSKRPLPQPPSREGHEPAQNESAKISEGSYESAEEIARQPFVPPTRVSSLSPAVSKKSSATSATSSEVSVDATSDCPAGDSDTSRSPTHHSPPSLSSSTDSVASLSIQSSHTSLFDITTGPEIRVKDQAQYPTSPSLAIADADLATSPKILEDTGLTQFDRPLPDELPPSTISTPPSPRFRRMKKPSLQVLLRRSVGSLRSLTSPTGANMPPSSGSPKSATGLASPRSNTLSPHVAEFVDQSSHDLLGLDLENDVADDDDDRRQTMKPVPGVRLARRRSSSSSPPSPSISASTPIADFYLTPAGSMLDVDDNTFPPLRPRPSATSIGSYRSEHSISISLEDDFEDDWAQSVLSAASTS